MAGNEILEEILMELKKHTEILNEHSKDIRSIKKSVDSLERTVNKWVFEELERLEVRLVKRIEDIERKIS
ncbi:MULTISPECIES: hypothetical protein [Dehalobacter]|uniref:hypothetical protein n=1 Tax=Dehalobacter TaxID=56112 RepID=UPI00030DCF1E|nr:hypothetical protein [Dehalobacter sp.]MDJ0304560.1 hypothetical protein [Dehalobacter sp.]